MKKFISCADKLTGKVLFSGSLNYNYSEATAKSEKRIQEYFPTLYIVLNLQDECFQLWMKRKDKKDNTIGYNFNYEQITDSDYILNLLNRAKYINEKEDLLDKMNSWEIEKIKYLKNEIEEHKRYLKDKYVTNLSNGYWLTRGKKKVFRRF